MFKRKVKPVKNGKQEPKTAHKEKKKSTGSGKKFTRSIVDVLNGNILSRDFVVANLSFLFFLTALVIVNIGYGYYTDKTAIRINELSEEISELKSESRAIESELNNKSMQTQVANAVDTLGLEESLVPPVILEVSTNEMLAQNQ